MSCFVAADTPHCIAEGAEDLTNRIHLPTTLSSISKGIAPPFNTAVWNALMSNLSPGIQLQTKTIIICRLIKSKVKNENTPDTKNHPKKYTKTREPTD